MMIKRLFIIAIAAVGVAMSSARGAADTLPSYAIPSPPPGDIIKGQVRSFNGRFELVIWDFRGFFDRVELHQGTIIKPVGLQLATGMIVEIVGHPDGSVFDAVEIDTPYIRYYP